MASDIGLNWFDQRMDEHHGALVQLRAYLSQRQLKVNSRLPPERELSQLVGASRGELRKALAILEEEGAVWRHVGKGTFVGDAVITDTYNLAAVAQRTNPQEVMRARFAIEPVLAGEAAHHSSPLDIAALQNCTANSREAASWRHYEAFDNRFHKLIADAAKNQVLSAMFDVLSGIRRTVVWGLDREETDRPPRDHHSFDEHDRIVEAIERRDRAAAAAAMLQHLVSVERYLFAASREKEFAIRTAHVGGPATHL
ncbi:FadR/GntR family transcriptional regulator [Pararhizobium haloflavum]|uniref:FadR/GntR family transcriptional regulator n=1 Tax=Pararhizobium haloflavum TaxID=2037914 RepID=UPI001FDF7158|nr:FCD domain-containing protein [Pararhizobium haloflavum]